MPRLRGAWVPAALPALPPSVPSPSIFLLLLAAAPAAPSPSPLLVCRHLPARRPGREAQRRPEEAAAMLAAAEQRQLR